MLSDFFRSGFSRPDQRAEDVATGDPAQDTTSDRQPNVLGVGTMSDRATEIVDGVRWYAEHRLDAPRMNERRSFDLSIIPYLAGLGVFGLRVPKQYRGQELSHADMAWIMMNTGGIDCNLCVLTAVQNTLAIPPILGFASDSLKKEILPPLAEGKILGTSALTEPGMGSFLGGMEAMATRHPDGGYVLNGVKKFISLGDAAQYVNVYAQLYDSSGRPRGITGFVVDTTTRGFIVGPQEPTFGLKAVPQNTLELRDVRVGEDAVLGEEGNGLVSAKSAFYQGRVALAAGSVGAMMRSLEIVHRYAMRRQVATGRLADNGEIHLLLNECAARTQAVQLLVQHIVSQLDAGKVVGDPFYFAAKISGPELMWELVDQCVNLLAGRGFLETNVVGLFFQDYRLFRIFEGSTEAITVYLGAKILDTPNKFAALLDDLDAPADIRELCTKIAGHLDAAVPTNTAQQHVLANIRGDLGCWTILAALTSAVADHSPMNQFTATWCMQQLQQLWWTAKTKLTWELPSVDMLAEHIAGYADLIGPPEERRAGEHRDRDPLIL